MALPLPVGIKKNRLGAPTANGARQASQPAPDLLHDLLQSSLILDDEWAALPPATKLVLEQCQDPTALLELLVEEKLLTNYQASRIGAGKRFGLMFGNYRVLDRLGAGGMGIVFKAQHVRMRRPVAIKVLPVSPEEDQYMLMRFFSEMRAVARLQHPNIVSAIDAGEVASPDPGGPTLHYFVMEYVHGKDLEETVIQDGPLDISRACDLAYQIASALAEAHKQDLVHRDIKPPNVLVTPEWQAKLLDFGLARHFRQRMTEPGTVLGTVDYIAPEQARDSSSVDIRADIYGLGGTLFWALTARTPFPAGHSITADLTARLTQPPPSIRTLRPDVSEELDAVISRMMALRPDDRYPEPQAVMRALLRFLTNDSFELRARSRSFHRGPVIPGLSAGPEPLAHREYQILIVDDEEEIRSLCQQVLAQDDLHCATAASGALALEALAARPFDLALIDVHMPGMSGLEVVRRFRDQPPCPNLKLIVFSGRMNSEEMSQALLAGADACVVKPFGPKELVAKVQSALQLKDAQDGSDRLAHQMHALNGDLECKLADRDSQLAHARAALPLVLTRLLEHCATETPGHLQRVSRYCRSLAEEAARMPAFAPVIDHSFVQALEIYAPLHDLGKLAVPEYILKKPGRLTAEERILMQEHTAIGAGILQDVARLHSAGVPQLPMAYDIVRHHHERFDGTGYPDQLAGDAIPLAARIVAFADVYDALRSRQVYKPALSQSATMQIMTQGSEGHFDPLLLATLASCAVRWEAIFRECPE